MTDLLDYILAHEDSFRKNRLPSLYSDFSTQKSTNPDGYAVNIAAWERALTNAARHGQIPKHATIGSATGKGIAKDGGLRRKSDHLVLHVDNNLLRDLESPEWGRPVGLGSVFDEALRKQTMVPLPIYKTSTASLNKSSWRMIDPSSFSPRNVMTWGLKQLKGLLIGPENASSSVRLNVQELVLVENLKEAGSIVISQATTKTSSRFDLIYSKERFIHDFASILDGGSELSDLDFEILLLYLSRDCNAIAYDGKTIKFRSAEDPTDITEQDTAVASLKNLIAHLTEQVNRLELKIAELEVSAKTALANKQRISALSALRSKKMTENSLKQRSDTLAQLEEVYSKIVSAADQVAVLQVMEASAGVLRGLNEKVGGIEKVEDVMEELRSEMDKTDETSTLIGSTIDEGEVDEELEALEKQELQAKENKEAEATRQKLAELDHSEQLAKSAAREAESRKADADPTLSESITKMSRMSLENPSQQEEREALKAE